ncbi:catenin alpha-like isoform X2 [Prorops nasuta]|uniref:catenin alpha-like isoform X2 n=1 Tax=Prorops nasuta TaxID=863751 RepID=UPI0034CD5AE5
MQGFEMPLKTKGMFNIIQPIIAQVTKLKQLFANSSDTKPSDLQKTSLFLEQIKGLIDKLDNISKQNSYDYQEMETKIISVVEEFCTLNSINELINLPNTCIIEESIEKLMNNLIIALKALEDLECLPLKQRLQDCYDYVKEMGTVKEIEDFQNLKELGTSILEIFGPLQKYRKNLISKLLQKNVALYSCQLHTTFSMLVHLVNEQHQLNAPIFPCKKYICERMCLCFQMMLEILNASNPKREDETFEEENHFVYRMDLVLDIISEMPNKSQEQTILECSQLWLGIEDVFSHAMAIAQVCQPLNFKAITGASQSIMAEYENLKIQLLSENPDPSLNNLFMNTLTDALYRLERKINIAVLTLVMEVFSDPFTALRKLVMTCGNSLNAIRRSKSDLTRSIEDFDQLTDKILTVGVFAIACCKDTTRINKIRNCLVGIESLDAELVSAITAFYLHPDNKEMRACVKLLTGQWQQEMNILHNAIDLIIDSAAYCQVILDDLQERISIMSNCLDNREGVTMTQVQGVIQRALSLSSQLTAIVNDIGDGNIDRQTTMMIRELKAAIFETDAAAKSELEENATEPQQLRVLKRCELILNVVKRLQPALVKVMNNSALIKSNYSRTAMGQGDTLYDNQLSFPLSIHNLPFDNKTVSYVKTPYTVKNYKPAVSIQPANSTIKSQPDLSCLIPYIRKGQIMRTERSFKLKTPKKFECSKEITNKNQLKMRGLSNIRQHLFSRESFALQSDIDLSAESIDITAILEKLTMLSATFSSSCNVQNEKAQSSTSSKGITANLLSNSYKSDSSNISMSSSFCLSNISEQLEKTNEYSTIGGGDAPSNIETPERNNDIQRLEKKLEELQQKALQK